MDLRYYVLVVVVQQTLAHNTFGPQNTLGPQNTFGPHKTYKGYGKLYSFIKNKRIKLTKGFYAYSL